MKKKYECCKHEATLDIIKTFAFLTLNSSEICAIKQELSVSSSSFTCWIASPLFMEDKFRKPFKFKNTFH